MHQRICDHCGREFLLNRDWLHRVDAWGLLARWLESELPVKMLKRHDAGSDKGDRESDDDEWLQSKAHSLDLELPFLCSLSFAQGWIGLFGLRHQVVIAEIQAGANSLKIVVEIELQEVGVLVGKALKIRRGWEDGKDSLL